LPHQFALGLSGNSLLVTDEGSHQLLALLTADLTADLPRRSASPDGLPTSRIRVASGQ
jgi:hypothetical protein